MVLIQDDESKSRLLFVHYRFRQYHFMVLIQEDESHDEHVIYYLIRSLTTTEIKYSHAEKLALVVVKVVQCFCHYILLCKTTFIFYCNPMQHILTR
jgi:hypothetical protein